MPAADQPGGDVYRYRVEQAGNRLDRLEDWRGKVDEERAAVRGELANVHRDLGTLNDAMEGMRKVLIGFALTIAASSLVFAFSVLLATGKL